MQQTVLSFDKGYWEWFVRKIISGMRSPVIDTIIFGGIKIAEDSFECLVVDIAIIVLAFWKE